MNRFQTTQDRTPGWQVVRMIERRGEMTVRDLVDASGVTTTAIRWQVDRLVADGLLVVARRAGRRGRPSDVFRLSDHARTLLDRRSHELAVRILNELDEEGGREKVRDLLGRIATRLADGYRQRITGGTAQERLGQYVKILREQGTAAELVQNGNGLIFRQFGCPYYKVACRNGLICDMDNQVLSHLTGQPVRHTQRMVDGHPVCEFEITVRTEKGQGGNGNGRTKKGTGGCEGDSDMEEEGSGRV